MTTIIGLEHKDRCFIVADSQTTDADGRIYTHPEVKKISESGMFLIAGSGETLACDIAQHIWEPPVPTKQDREDLYHFMIVKAMPSLRKCMSENGYNFDEPHERSKDGLRFQLLLSVGGEIFDISDDLSVCRSGDGIYGIGSGSAFAIGALHAGAKPQKAMDIAATVTAFTAGPFQTVEQFK